MTALQGAADRSRSRDQPRFLELVLLIILVLIFIRVATRTIWELRVAAEQVSVMHTVGAIKSALGVHVAYTVMKSGADELAPLHKSNPFQFLKEPLPANFELLTQPRAAEELQPYRWYFDAASGVLIYRVGNEEQLETSLPGPARIRFQLQLRFEDRNGNGRFDKGSDTVAALQLVTLEPYRWRDPI